MPIWLLGLRYRVMTQMFCPLGLHWRRTVALQRAINQESDGRCVFCGAK